MKISKVERKKVAVAKKQYGGKSKEGILYSDPIMGSSYKEMKEYVSHRVNMILNDGMYTIFPLNKKTVDEDEISEEFEDVIVALEKLIDKLNRDFENKILKGYKKVREKQENTIKDFKEYTILTQEKDENGNRLKKRCYVKDLHFEIKDKILEEFVKNFAYEKLKYSLNRQLFREGLVKIILCLCDGKNYGDSITKMEKDCIGNFLDALNKDAQKMNIKQIRNSKKERFQAGKDICTSIEKQDVKVYVDHTEKNKTVLKLSIEKGNQKPLVNFMKEYAKGEKQALERMNRLRYLLSVYFFGEDEECIQSVDQLDKIYILPVDLLKIYGFFSEEAIATLNNLSYSQREKIIRTREIIREKNIQCYRNAMKTKNLTDVDCYFIGCFERYVEQQFEKDRNLTCYNLEYSKIVIKIWNHLLSSIAMKYIELGKGVYHFVMPKNIVNLSKSGYKEFGQVLPEYTKDDITSFDYEIIKAKESIERYISVAVTFALGNFTRAVAPKEISDFLYAQKEENEIPQRKDAILRVLRFFGGASKKREFQLPEKGSMLIEETKNAIKAIRNQNFHYSISHKESNTDYQAIPQMLLLEKNTFGKIICKTYYSNNVPVFYKDSDIVNMLTWLYDKYKVRPAQIPAFARVLKRKEFPQLMELFVKKSTLEKIKQSEYLEKFEGALYYILKEVFYQKFVYDERTKNLFMEELDKAIETGILVKEEKEKKKNNPKALDDFREMIQLFSGSSFEVICQKIQQEVALQNSGKKGNNNRYDHYKILLPKLVLATFISYMRGQKETEFLKTPLIKENITNLKQPEEYLMNWNTKMYDDVIDEKNTEICNWYIIMRYLPANQLNHLIGNIKDYVQFCKNIKERAKSSGSSWKMKDQEEIDKYESLQGLMEFCLKLNGRISENFEDYYESKEEFALYISKFVDFGAGVEDKDIYKQLQKFAKADIRYSGIYTDAENPKVNRNIELARMYGSETLLEKCLKNNRISMQEIKDYCALKERLQEIFTLGICKNDEQQKELRRFQILKNRVELQDIQTYSQVIADLLSYTIQWSYMRERDQLYLGLGYYYLTSNNDRDKICVTKKGIESLEIKEGFSLYETMSVFTFNMPFYKTDGKSISGATSNKIGKYYHSYPEYKCPMILFDQGFTNNNETYDQNTSFRNTLDHFHYYKTQKKSLMEIYSYIYSRYLNYDLKLKRSVPVVLQKIMENYFVNVSFYFKDGKDQNGRKMTEIQLEKQISEGKIYLSQKKGEEVKAISMPFTYKIEKKPLKIAAKGEKFLKGLQDILEFKEK